jgi:hypothetical protein
MNGASGVSAGGGDAIGSDLPGNGQGGYGQRRPRQPPAPPETLTSKGHRLEISQDPDTGAWVYTVTDRDTGEVLMQRERDDVVRLGLTPDYAAGTLVKARA